METNKPTLQEYQGGSVVEGRGRFVEDQDSRLGRDGPGDGHELLERGGQRLHGQVDVDVEFELLQGGPSDPALLAHPQQRTRPRLSAEDEILRDRPQPDQHRRWTGTIDYRLVRQTTTAAGPGNWRIAWKIIVLIDAEGPQENLTIIL